MLRVRNPVLPSRQQGVGMTEVLVALLITAVGVLGYAGMQLFALQGSEEAGYRTHATLIARDGLERMLLNADPDAINIYFSENNWPVNVPFGGDYPALCMANACGPVDLANADIAQLSWTAANSLPGGLVTASDDCGGAPSPSCIVVTWGEMAPQECLDAYPAIPNTADYNCVVLEAIRP